MGVYDRPTYSSSSSHSRRQSNIEDEVEVEAAPVN
jgi:hypothetical protein